MKRIRAIEENSAREEIQRQAMEEELARAKVERQAIKEKLARAKAERKATDKKLEETTEHNEELVAKVGVLWAGARNSPSVRKHEAMAGFLTRFRQVIALLSLAPEDSTSGDSLVLTRKGFPYRQFLRKGVQVDKELYGKISALFPAHAGDSASASASAGLEALGLVECVETERPSTYFIRATKEAKALCEGRNSEIHYGGGFITKALLSSKEAKLDDERRAKCVKTLRTEIQAIQQELKATLATEGRDPAAEDAAVDEVLASQEWLARVSEGHGRLIKLLSQSKRPATRRR
jgi:hypothetical protein